MSTERWAVVEIDLGAIDHNVRLLRAAAGDAELWAVVKADGYGHGSVRVARAALDAGAAGLCVALTQEAVELRAAGIEAPILLLSQQPPEHAAAIVEHRLIPAVYTLEAVDALAAAASVAEPLGVHVKVDTGMQRVGVRPDDAAELLDTVRSSPGLRLAGVFTHLAVADDDTADHLAFTAEQLAAFDRVLAAADVGDDVVIHAANSAATMIHPTARRRVVRAGIAMYGISPGRGVDRISGDVDRLRPAMALRARVSHVKRVEAGTRISYGLRHRFERDTTVATVPIGYADGVPRRLWSVGGEVLVGGVRCPIVGVVTMDQLMLDVGAVADPVGTGAGVRGGVGVGDEVVLIGAQGGERIRAEEWAERLDTIAYEIVCGVSARVPRVERLA